MKLFENKNLANFIWIFKIFKIFYEFIRFELKGPNRNLVLEESELI
jgi:hypothetical protein